MPARSARTRVTAAALVALSFVALAGCAAAESDARTPSSAAPPATAEAVVEVEPGGVTDAQSCEAFDDVNVILHNAYVALRENRIGEREYQGWMRLATRVLDRVPTTGSGPVHDAVERLKAAAPPVPLGSMGGTPIGTPEWSASAPLAQACEDAGEMLITEGFTGG